MGNILGFAILRCFEGFVYLKKKCSVPSLKIYESDS